MTKPFDIETARMYHDRYGSISPILAMQLDMALDEIDRLRAKIHNAKAERCTDSACECCDLILVELDD